MKGRSCGLFLCLFLGIACFSGYQVLRILHEYRVGADAYFKLEQFASLPPASEETEETPAELAWTPASPTRWSRGRTMTITWTISWTARPTAPGAFLWTHHAGRIFLATTR